MSTLKSVDFVNNLLDFFRETFEGTNGQGSHYIDGRGHGSFLETLDRVGHVEASKPLQEGGVTIAAHTAHTLYYLQTLETFMSGGEVKTDWAASWRIRTVNEAEWTQLKSQLRKQYEDIQQLFKSDIDWNDDHISDAFSLLMHSAYHLGAVRLIAVTLN